MNVFVAHTRENPWRTRMLVSQSITDERERARIARQAALMLGAVHMHKQDVGLPPAILAIDAEDAALLAEARDALDIARRENGHDVWGVIHHLSDYETTRRFLDP